MGCQKNTAEVTEWGIPHCHLPWESDKRVTEVLDLREKDRSCLNKDRKWLLPSGLWDHQRGAAMAYTYVYTALQTGESLMLRLMYVWRMYDLESYSEQFCTSIALFTKPCYNYRCILNNWKEQNLWGEWMVSIEFLHHLLHLQASWCTERKGGVWVLDTGCCGSLQASYLCFLAFSIFLMDSSWEQLEQCWTEGKGSTVLDQPFTHNSDMHYQFDATARLWQHHS